MGTVANSIEGIGCLIVRYAPLERLVRGAVRRTSKPLPLHLKS